MAVTGKLRWERCCIQLLKASKPPDPAVSPAVQAFLLFLCTFQAVSYVSRRRMDHPDFDPYEVDADGLPLVYNEERIAGFWKGKPGMHMRLYDTDRQTKEVWC